jgi:hypothetical protein
MPQRLSRPPVGRIVENTADSYRISHVSSINTAASESAGVVAVVSCPRHFDSVAWAKRRRGRNRALRRMNHRRCARALLGRGRG